MENMNITEKKNTLYEYLDKMGIMYSVDRNPSPEKIASIKEGINNRLKREKEAQATFRSLEGKN